MLYKLDNFDNNMTLHVCKLRIIPSNNLNIQRLWVFLCFNCRISLKNCNLWSFNCRISLRAFLWSCSPVFRVLSSFPRFIPYFYPLLSISPQFIHISAFYPLISAFYPWSAIPPFRNSAIPQFRHSVSAFYPHPCCMQRLLLEIPPCKDFKERIIL